MAYAMRRRPPADTLSGGTLSRRGRGAAAAGNAALTLARIVRFVFGVLAAIIIAAIVLRLLGANPGNAIVTDIHSWASTLVGPFRNLFTIHDPKVAITVNWGLAAIVYLVVGGLIAKALARMALSSGY